MTESLLTRWHSDRVRPLEVWNFVFERRKLNDWYRNAPKRLGAAFGALVDCLHKGHPLTVWQPRPEPHPELAHVHFMGGGVDRAPTSLPGVEVTVVEGSRYTAARAGRSLANTPVVVDVGQTSIKVVFGDTERSFERPEGLDNKSGTREAFVEYVSMAIRDTLGSETPRSGVLALPCPIDADLRVSAGTYPYPNGDPLLLRDIVKAAGLDTDPVCALNDAELAAHAASLDAQVPTNATTLVVTLGKYVGAALLLKCT